MTSRNNHGLTLIEIMVVVVILGILTAVALSAFRTTHREAADNVFISNLRTIANAVRIYQIKNGCYPEDTFPGYEPPGLRGSLQGLAWGQTTPIGGKWDWSYNLLGYTASIGVFLPRRTAAQMTEIDARIDDGNLKTGNFRTCQISYVLVIEP